MYGYENHIDITPEQILQKVTQESIFELVLGQPFDFNERYISPFRDDTRPDCRFELRIDSTIVFVDFGEKFNNPHKTHRSCFGMVMDRYGVSLEGAIRIICQKFNLSTSISDYTPITTTHISKPHIDTVIRYEKKDFNKSDVAHWNQFLIKTDHLVEDSVFSAKKFSINSSKGYRVINVYKYCYIIDFIDTVKIYQPYSTKYKWITNCNENCIGNIDNLPSKGDELIIQKSYKDHRVLRNIIDGLNIIWFQNEGCIPSMEILSNLIERFKLITIFFDNDYDGILAAIRLHEIFSGIKEGCCRIVHLPVFISRNLTHKDPSEFIHGEGRKDTIQVLKQIKLL